MSPDRDEVDARATRAAPTRGRGRAIGTVVALVLAMAGAVASGALLLRPPTDASVLLAQDDFDGVWSTEQNSADAAAPGWTWCESMRPGNFEFGPLVGSRLELDHASVGATILDLSDQGVDAEALIAKIGVEADRCVSFLDPEARRSLEELPALDDPDAVGWRTVWGDVAWGEYAIMPLEANRVLAVGFVVQGDDEPIDLDDLIALAKQGAEQFPAES